MLAAAVILAGAVMVIVGGGELPLTGIGAVALVAGAVLAARDAMAR